MARRRYLQEQRHPRLDSRRKMGNSASIMGWSLLTKDMLKATSTIMISLKISGWKGGKLDGFKPFCNLTINRLEDVLLGAFGLLQNGSSNFLLVTSRYIFNNYHQNPWWNALDILDLWILGGHMEDYDGKPPVLGGWPPGFGTASSTRAKSHAPTVTENKWPLAVQENGIESSPNSETDLHSLNIFRKGKGRGCETDSQRE